METIKKETTNGNSKLLHRRKYCFSLQVSRWINDKLPVALDENYRDPSNLQGKQQKHATFEAEIHANKSVIDQIDQVVFRYCIISYIDKI